MKLTLVSKLGCMAATLVLAVSCALPAKAYPEFQQFAEKNSGRTTDCAMCHVNSTGPIGTGEGQIGSLTPADIAKLNEEHGALEPGVDVHSPILNAFGNKIIQTLGRKKFIELKQHPQELQAAMKGSDLDDDGIPDGTEFANGTDPLNKNHGDLLQLFLVNINRYKLHVVLALISVLLLDFGFVQLLRGCSALSKSRQLRRGTASPTSRPAINPATDVATEGNSLS